MANNGSTDHRVAGLVKRFREHSGSYKSAGYNETQLRREFLDPFFDVLGWDVNNRQGYAEPYKDVIHEDAIRVGGAVKAPDYCFRIGGTRKFFVEAKKPSVNLKDDISPAFQIRRYAWSAKLPLSILTDFEEFAVYDCRVKPLKTDRASMSRILYFTYEDYLDEWDRISSIFARESVLKGSFDRYAEAGRHKRGTAEVDDEFLMEIESWRNALARNMAIRNPRLSQRELNFAVQRIIDRIIFLRICEDRGIEDYGRLMSLLNGDNVYKRMFEYFRKADERYNSGLFHFEHERDRPGEPDGLTPLLKVDDRQLKDIIRRLYYPDSPYEFSVLPADILGQVYEQFLGKVIRLTEGHQARVEEKPEVRKAGGVYYTPTYIVDYIVGNTVGRLVEGSTPKKVERLRFLDPACGSGSFLIGAYRYLLDWHRDWYAGNDPERHVKGKKPVLFQAGEDDWRLTTAEKKRILLNNIYGVDIDSQAVEVTKLSLLLKVLEGETDETLQRQLRIFHERALPDLRSNIKCGNSLIGPDFYEGRNMGLFDEEEQYRVNVFDWESEFSEIMKAGGFDAVIGNPPYVRIQALKEWVPIEVEHYKKHYASASKGNYDIYVVFVEKGLSLLNEKGRFGYILPHKFFQAQYGEPVREIISKGKHLSEIVYFGDRQVFEGATTYTCLMFLSRSMNKEIKYMDFDLNKDIISLNTREDFQVISSEILTSNAWNFYTIAVSEIIKKINCIPIKLTDITNKIFKGSSTGNDKIYILRLVKEKLTTNIVYSEHLEKEIELEKDILKPFLYGSDIKRYCEPQTQTRILFLYEITGNKASLISVEKLKKEYPLTFKYLTYVKSVLMKRRINLSVNDYYKYSAARSLIEYSQLKILVPDILVKNRIAIDKKGLFYHGPAIHSIVFNSTVQDYSPLFFLGILNSAIFWFYLRHTSTALRGNAYRLIPQFLEPFPIILINLSKPKDKARHDRMVEMVDSMLDLNKRLQVAMTDHEKNTIKRQIDYTDNRIDSLVYELYGLTEEEIRIVEGNDEPKRDPSV